MHNLFRFQLYFQRIYEFSPSFGLRHGVQNGPILIFCEKFKTLTLDGENFLSQFKAIIEINFERNVKRDQFHDILVVFVEFAFNTNFVDCFKKPLQFFVLVIIKPILIIKIKKLNQKPLYLYIFICRTCTKPLNRRIISPRIPSFFKRCYILFYQLFYQIYIYFMGKIIVFYVLFQKTVGNHIIQNEYHIG